MKDGWKKNEDGVLCHQSLLYMPEIVRTKLISRYHDYLLTSYFGINKTQKLITQKYYWPIFCRDVEAYLIGCDICLTLKTVRHKPYSDLQLLLVSTY